jgi:hypothetical protein
MGFDAGYWTLPSYVGEKLMCFSELAFMTEEEKAILVLWLQAQAKVIALKPAEEAPEQAS